MATLAKILDLLAATGRSLSSVVAGLPSVHVAHETVSTPWERKGTVMRTTLEQAQDRELVLVDGIKVLHADGWALVLPDPEEPLTHVWAEGDSDGGARALAQEYVGRIRAALVTEPGGPMLQPRRRQIRASLAAVLALVGFLTLVASSGVKDAKRGAESRRAGLVKLIHTRQDEVESLGQELVAAAQRCPRRPPAPVVDVGRRGPPAPGRPDVGRDHSRGGAGLEVRLSDSRREAEDEHRPAVAVGPRRRPPARGQRLVGGRRRGRGGQRAAAGGDVADPGGGRDDHRELPPARPAVQGRGGRRRPRPFERSAAARRFQQWSEDFGLGFSVRSRSRLVLPAYVGTLQLSSARPVDPAPPATPGPGGR